MAFSSNIFAQATDYNLFGEYIGAQFKDVKFSDVPIYTGVNFHFMLAFAIDYTTSTSPPTPTNGKFNVYWDTGNLSAAAVRDIKSQHSNVKVALSLGGDTVSGQPVYFMPDSVDSWVDNAVSSLTGIINEYDLDGIDINYEHFSANVDTFAECVGRLIKKLKDNGAISFASIAPFGSSDVQNHYQALWKKYASVIDFVNFQFYAYNIETVAEFVKYFDQEISNYEGGRILASFVTDQSRGFTPDKGFFTACAQLKNDGKLGGIFLWSADTSKGNDFKYEKQSQAFLLE